MSIPEPLAPWQREIMEALERGESITAHRGKRHGKRALTRSAAAALELDGERWDIVGPNAPQLRREAREEAAAVADLFDPLRAPGDTT